MSSTEFRFSRNSSGGSSSRKIRMQFSASNFIQAPLSALLEYSGILRTRSSHQETEGLINGGVTAGFGNHTQNRLDDSAGGNSGGEISIRIIGAREQEHARVGAGLTPSSLGQVREGNSGEHDGPTEQIDGAAAASDHHGDTGDEGGEGEGVSSSLSSISTINPESSITDGVGGRDSSYQRYDIQQVTRWIEQILPFSLLLLVVFIRQHLQGFFVTIWIAAVMFKSNDILRKQTALKGERKISVLVGITIVFMLHVAGIYWWYRNDDILYPLVMLPPKAIPVFWHAIFIIMVNGPSFFAALKALSHKEVHYGSYATSEQVNAAGDLCAICQEKMHAPILLRCKHIFCEDCVSEWFERERTCPLCRALVKAEDLRSFGNGSTSLFFQLF